MPKTQLPAELEAAVNALYIARRDRQAHPQGKLDKGGRWYPSDEEDADGFTATLRSPSAAWPYSYMTGARTRKHITALALVNPQFVLAQAARFLTPAPTANAAD